MKENLKQTSEGKFAGGSSIRISEMIISVICKGNFIYY